METLVVKNGYLIDPANNFEGPADLLLADGKIKARDKPGAIGAGGAKVVEAGGAWVLPGLIDLHVHLRDPGQEYKEDLASGLAAAAAGGFTGVLAMPNTSPPVDQASQVESLARRAEKIKGARLYQSAAMTRGQKGSELTEYDDLRSAGCPAVTDDGRWVSDAAVMRRILGYASVCDLLPLSHCQENTLAPNGLVNEGRISARLGLAGSPAEVEYLAVHRDVSLSRLTGKRVHLCHLSARRSVEIVRQAKAEGLPVTCETAPHYLTLTENNLGEYDANCKINPPLRAEEDRLALLEGVRDGTIDLVATDHAPHSVLEKEVEFLDAAFGAIGLETALPLVWEVVQSLGLPKSRLAELLSWNPARILGVPGGALGVGSPADLTLFDPAPKYRYDAATSKSKSRNSPFHGRELVGRVLGTIVGGRIVHQA